MNKLSISNDSLDSNAQKIKENYQKISSVLGKAKLLAVTKYTSDENVNTLYRLGHRDFGENRVEELSKRASHFPLDINWHFIGNLQSNKLKKLFSISNLRVIHSIDRISLLEKIIEIDPACEFYLQFNASGEKEKNGFISIESLKEAIDIYRKARPKCLKLVGLMTMAAIRTDQYEDDAKSSFTKLANIKKQIESEYPDLFLNLNMGMSQDYQLAIEAGSDLVRVGSALFE